VVALLIARLTLIRLCCRRSARNLPTPTSAFLFASLLWAALFGFGTFLCNTSGNQTLFLLGNVCAVGVIGGLAGRNAGTPRLVLLQISFILALLGLGAALSPGCFAGRTPRAASFLPPHLFPRRNARASSSHSGSGPCCNRVRKLPRRVMP
jgi:hypothetical protein